MTFNFRPKLMGFGIAPELPLTVTHPNHIAYNRENFLNQGSKITEMGKKIGTDAVSRSGTFQEAMLGALDKVSATQQFASSLHEAAIIDPDSVDAHDITIAQAEASMSLNITRNVLNRLVQGWRDLINTR
jgi:flagellar hook-basal body complex protein FliE